MLGVARRSAPGASHCQQPLADQPMLLQQFQEPRLCFLFRDASLLDQFVQPVHFSKNGVAFGLSFVQFGVAPFLF